MRSAPAAVIAYLAANNVTARADLYTVTLVDGSTIYRWTNFDTDLVVSGQTYRSYGAAGPLIKRGTYSQNNRLAVDTLDLTLSGRGFLIGGKTLGLLSAQGYFDGARIQVDHLIMPKPGDVSLGPIPSWFEGRVAEVEPIGSGCRMRIKSELETLTTRLPKFLIQPSCSNAVYDTNCALNKATYTDSGTATGGTTTTLTTATGAITGKAANYYWLGVVKFTSGSVLNGLKRAVLSSSGGTITFGLPLPIAPTTETFTIYPGCDMTRTMCISKFSNANHFRGYPHVPTPEGGS